MNEETVELVNAEHTAFAAPIAFVVLLLIGQVWHEHQGLLTVAALAAFVFSLVTVILVVRLPKFAKPSSAFDKSREGVEALAPWQAELVRRSLDSHLYQLEALGRISPETAAEVKDLPLGTLGGCARAARTPFFVSVNQNE